MHFCPNCENMLIMKKESNEYSYCCNTCTYSYALEKTLKKTSNYVTKEEETVWHEEESLKNLDFCDKRCECGETRVSFYQMQTRSADEPMTIFYNCIKCKRHWRE